jgi:import inner membrane translocase subunit TIM23
MSRPAMLQTARSLASTTTRLAAPAHRHASTSTSTLESTTPTTLPMTWPNYLSLRKQRKAWSGITTVPTTVGGLFLGGSYFASVETDPSQLIMGVEAM